MQNCIFLKTWDNCEVNAKIKKEKKIINKSYNFQGTINHTIFGKL